MHVCGTSKCPYYQKYSVAADYRCYLQMEASKIQSDKLVFFDFETDQSSGSHEVNFAVAQYFDGKEVVFEGYSACGDFSSLHNIKDLQPLHTI
jgi:hypothetical protein